VDRIDPKTNKVSKTIELMTPNVEGGIAVGDNMVWVTATGFPITRIDPATETVAQQFFGEGGGAILFTAGQTSAIWLSNLNNGTLWRIDPRRVLATLAE
jgi:streptogramin lyase